MNIQIQAAALAATFIVASASAAIVGSDNGSNYSSGWTNGSNGGTGFGAWSFSTSGGGYKGNFIGNPGNIGITGMGSSAFALYANGGSGASITASRSFGAALGIGDSFSMQWGIKWDSDFGGNKGFNLFAGTNEVINVNNGGNNFIMVNGNNVGFGYGTNAMTWTFTQTTATTVTVTANDRDGSGSYSAVITVSGALSGFSIYASNMGGGGNREPFYNNFTLDAVPAPGALALLGVAGIVGARRRR
jgi:MYXO-CTERM domain-containing protein